VAESRKTLQSSTRAMAPQNNGPHVHAYHADSNSSYMQGPAAAPPLIRAALHSDSANSFTEGALNTRGQSFSMIGRHGIDVAGIYFVFVTWGRRVDTRENEAKQERRSARERVRDCQKTLLGAVV